uniref:Uncharacterized protein n=1 Tax=Anguilla anguilla TaxID=7936 RepID=A0A0E9VPY7_ANGAN
MHYLHHWFTGSLHSLNEACKDMFNSWRYGL